MRNGRRLGALALAAVLGISAAGCGDDGEEADATGTGTATGVEDEQTTTTTDPDEVDDLSEIPGFEGLSEDCQVFAQVSLAFGAAFTGAFGGGDDGDFDDVAAELEQFVDDVPEEVRDDVAVIARAFEEYATAIEDIDLTDQEAMADPEVLAQVTEAAAVFESPEVQEASDNLDEYANENCELDELEP